MTPATTDGNRQRPTDDDQLTTVKETKQRPDTPLRGVRCFERHGKPSPFGVEWRVGEKRKTEWFTNPSDRDRRATALRKQRRANALALVPTRGELHEWLAFKAAIGGARWQDVVEAWRRKGGSSSTLTVGQAVERYVAEQDERMAQGRLAAVTHKKNCPKARAFAADFSSKPVTAVNAEEIEEWIDDLGFEAAETFNTYRKVIHAVFESCRKECPYNPAADVELRDDRGDVGIISVDDTARLLTHASGNCPEILPRLALECFAGIRFSSAFRLERSDINFEDRGILLPSHKLKTGRRHYIDGLPENLFDWLALETPATWALSAREYRRLKSKCFDDAEPRIPHPHNCLRHGFCTYHVAAFKNPGLTATILCHRDQNLLWTTYNGRATQREGLRFFELRPAEPAGRKPVPRR